ncbi:hypothetical protein ETAA8_31640 [Anatilimnocola aggregata]|uniref:Uncharacterized protein n=1 Tax=Anatilimnocola aggregata TaxID=2528021 RepID=A0A517YD65_9BACT|nr:hypothetical protein ETAA8_31640 [Anatilimnocola aggregata]
MTSGFFVRPLHHLIQSPAMSVLPSVPAPAPASFKATMTYADTEHKSLSIKILAPDQGLGIRTR